MSHITAIRIVSSDGTERSIPISQYTQAVRDEYMKFLPEEEVNKDKLYEHIGFCLSVLESIRNT